MVRLLSLFAILIVIALAILFANLIDKYLYFGIFCVVYLLIDIIKPKLKGYVTIDEWIKRNHNYSKSNWIPIKEKLYSVCGKVFLITTPFALFCSGNVPGWIQFFIYLLLGIMCIYIGNGGIENAIKVKPKEMWEAIYKYRMLYHSKMDTKSDEAVRKIADMVTRDNYCPMPTEEEKEQIARSMGIVTKKMLQEEDFRIDKLQFGKRYLMERAANYFKDNPKIINKCLLSLFFSHNILQCANLIKYANGSRVSFVSIFELERRFGTRDVGEIWNSVLSEEERAEARLWTEECIERLKKEETDYCNKKITTKRDVDYQKQYGFRIKGRYDE